jgi:hypothetical protein
MRILANGILARVLADILTDVDPCKWDPRKDPCRNPLLRILAELLRIPAKILATDEDHRNRNPRKDPHFIANCLLLPSY